MLELLAYDPFVAPIRKWFRDGHRHLSSGLRVFLYFQLCRDQPIGGIRQAMLMLYRLQMRIIPVFR